MPKILTIDFDETLATAAQDAILGEYALFPIKRVIDFVKEKHKEGWELHIVTFRHTQYKQEVIDFCEEYQIPISSIVCTCSNEKTPTLLELKSDLHIDDHVETLVLAKQTGIDTLMVDWNQEKYNITAKYFDKI